MSDKNNQPQTKFQIKSIFLKNVSFQAPKAISNYKSWQPKVDIDVQTKHESLPENTYEVVLTVKLKATMDTENLFSVEIQQAAEFFIEGLEQNKLEHVLQAYCASMIYPYARQNITDVIVKGGFPPLYLSPIDFEAQYAQQKMKQEKDKV